MNYNIQINNKIAEHISYNFRWELDINSILHAEKYSYSESVGSLTHRNKTLPKYKAPA